MKPQRVSEFSVYLDQRPGELAGVLGAFDSGGVLVTALAVGEHNGRGLVRVLGEPLEAMRRVCESLIDSGVGPIIESEVLSVNVEHRPNALRDLTTAMADERINLRYAYLAPRRGEQPARCVFRVDDLDEVIQKIEAIDWPQNGIGPGPGQPPAAV